LSAVLPDLRRVSRALRVLLACTWLWVAAGTAAPGTFIEQRAVPVLVGSSKVAAATRSARVSAPAELPAGALRCSFNASQLVPCAPASADFVAIDDRCLRHCRLLI
jgi:hypothetical protein